MEENFYHHRSEIENGRVTDWRNISMHDALTRDDDFTLEIRDGEKPCVSSLENGWMFFLSGTDFSVDQLSSRSQKQVSHNFMEGCVIY